MYQLEPWDKDSAKAEADKYRKYGLISVFYWMACFVIVILLCVPINLLVMGDIMADDLKDSLLFVVGFALGGIFGVLTIIGKFKDKLDRGY